MTASDWIILACIGGVALAARSTATRDAAAGYTYWQPWRVILMAGVGGLILAYAAFVIVVSALQPAPA